MFERVPGLDQLLLDEAAQSLIIRISLVLLLIHLLFRVVAMFQRPHFLDETPYKVRFMSPSKRIGTQNDDQQPAPRRLKTSSSSRSRSSSPPLMKSQQTGKIILVTGSSGRIGSQVVKLLANTENGEFLVRGVDMYPPNPNRKCTSDRVEYITMNLVDALDSDVALLLRDVVGVVHCAGSLMLQSLLKTHVHNSIPFLTAKLLALSKESPSVQAFVHTSSVFVVNNASCNLNAIPNDAPYLSKYSSYWARCHMEAEKLVLEAGDDPSSTAGRFFTCVNRFPGVFGFRDELMVTVMVEYELSVFTSRDDVRSELLYLKNAAHAHLCALRSLLDPQSRSRAAGKANVITQSSMGETWTNLAFWQRLRRSLGIHRSFVLLPTWLFYVVAMFLDGINRFVCGLVFPNSVIWNFTWTFLDHVTHDNTYLGQAEAFHSIGYRPQFSNESSFEDMARESKEVPLRRAKPLGHDPRLDVDWEPRDMPQTSNLFRNVFLATLGPGPSWHEVALFWLAYFLSLGFAAWVSIQHHYSWFEMLINMGLASWHIPGCVVSVGPSHKRWSHMEGKVGLFWCVLMLLDASISVWLAGWVFGNVEWMLTVGVILFNGILLIVSAVPLKHQRAYAVICTLLLGLGLYLNLFPSVRVGMEWLLPILGLKFFICHAPRHEPYF